jgi:hypothetical protein
VAGIVLGVLGLACGAFLFHRRRMQRGGLSANQAAKRQQWEERNPGSQPFLALSLSGAAAAAPMDGTSGFGPTVGEAGTAHAPAQVTSMDTRNIGKYFVGMRLQDFGPMRVTGTVTSIMPNIPGSTSGPGRFEVTHDAALPSQHQQAGASTFEGSGATTTMDTRSVSKYHVGLRLEAFGPTRVTGIVSQVIPNIPGSQGGAGKIVVTHDQNAPPPRTLDADGTPSELATNATVVSIENRNKYHLGQRLFGPSRVQGTVTAIAPGPNNTGEITITHDADVQPPPAPEAEQKHTVLDSSNVSKYWVGMRLDNFGPTQVNGTVVTIIPTDPSNAGGPGRIIVKHDEAAVAAPGTGAPRAKSKKSKSVFSKFGRKKKK